MNRPAAFLLAVALLAACPEAGAQRAPKPNITASRPAQQQQQPAKPAVQHIRVEDGTITADITNSPLHNVLLELAERTGVIFEVRTQSNPPVSIHLNRVPLQEAVERVTAGNDTMFVYDEEPNGDRIKMVRVFSRTGNIVQPGIVYLGTGEITKRGKPIETPEQALEALAGDSTLEEREKSISVLVHARTEAAVKALMNCISDSAPEIRIAAIEGLASLNAATALPAIIKSLKDRHPGVRQSATTAVALLGDATNIKDLKPLSRDLDPGVAASAETAIRKLSGDGKIR